MSHELSKPILQGVLLTLLLIVPVCAGQSHKISNYGNAHQIWFEAEDYDERNPDTDQYYPVVDQAGAFGKAVSRAGGAGGMIRWTFDVSKTGGRAGTWYFWARLINPGNTSDYMLVEGDPGDATIPTGPPFPGDDGAAPFDNADDRIFEGDFGPPWAWGQAWDLEGHIKELQDGENTMYIFHRQGDETVFWDVFMWTDSATYVPTDEDYRNATEVLPGKSFSPSPTDGAVDVPRDVMLRWLSELPAATHDVYFGTVFEDVSTADRANAMGVLASLGQTATTYDPEGLLEYGQTYFWRIDEVNAAPDYTVFEGGIWSFTVEPFVYPIAGVIATSNASSDAGADPENTVNGSGLNANDQHSIAATDMWLTLPGQESVYVQYEFDRVYKLHEMLVWNYNVQFEPVLGFGLKNVTVEYSQNGTDWTALGDVDFAKATAKATYTANTTVGFGGVPAKYVRLNVNSGWGMLGQFGLSEVRFLFIPAQAREPQPADGAADVEPDTVLRWRAGRNAVSHDVYLGTDPQG